MFIENNKIIISSKNGPLTCQSTEASFPLLHRSEVNDHPASLGVMHSQHIESPCVVELEFEYFHKIVNIFWLLC